LIQDSNQLASFFWAHYYYSHRPFRRIHRNGYRPIWNDAKQRAFVREFAKDVLRCLVSTIDDMGHRIINYAVAYREIISRIPWRDRTYRQFVQLRVCHFIDHVNFDGDEDVDEVDFRSCECYCYSMEID
jgi:hypothetical protein